MNEFRPKENEVDLIPYDLWKNNRVKAGKNYN